MTIQREIERYLPLREEQMGSFTDSILIRNTVTGACGLASCTYVEWRGTPYAVSCHHILREGHEYISGARRISGSRIDEEDSHEVAPLTFINSDADLDLSVFDLNRLHLDSVPKRAYDINADDFSLDRISRNLQCVSFIHGVPGFSNQGIQYHDGLVFMSSPVYSAYGPIVEVTNDLIVGDFAETECIELNTAAFPQLNGFEPNRGTRNLSGMSGSGLWVISSESFAFLGTLIGEAQGNNRISEHRIRFTPVWKLREWLASVIHPRA